MVDTAAEQRSARLAAVGSGVPSAGMVLGAGERRSEHRTLPRLGFVVVLAMVTVALVIVLRPGSAPAAEPSKSPSSVNPVGHLTRIASDPGTTSAAPATVPAAPAPAPAPAPASPAAGQVSVASSPSPLPVVAALVAQVEAAGIVPGANWSWSIGDTAGLCGITSTIDMATGCTAWSSGVERTVFSGSPSLALVAHEVANAETEQFATPAMLNEVGAIAAGTSWSPTDAVASCLVAHFLGFQDSVAGSWRCPAPLATSVGAHIHDAIVSTETTAICGTTSGASSTLTFTASAGTLTVTSPGGSTLQSAVAGTPLTVTGVGRFTANDVGGTAAIAGLCEA